MPAHPKSEITIVGDSVTGPVLCQAFLALGKPAKLVLLDLQPPASRRRRGLVHVGNGEYFANARKIFGAAMAEEIWAVSQRSYQLAERQGFTPVRLLWMTSAAREREYTRTGRPESSFLCFRPSA